MTPLLLQVGRVVKRPGAERAPSYLREFVGRMAGRDAGLAAARAFNPCDPGPVIQVDEFHARLYSAFRAEFHGVPAGGVRKWQGPAFLVHLLIADKWARVGVRNEAIAGRADKVPLGVEFVGQWRLRA